MNKQNQPHAGHGAGNNSQTETGPWLEKITDTMKDTAATPEQLPALWQQIAAPDGQLQHRDRLQSWENGIEAMFRRCTTYPQHRKLDTAIYALPRDAWQFPYWSETHANNLVKQATPEQLVQALADAWEGPGVTQYVSADIELHASTKKLTEAVIAQLPWRAGMRYWAKPSEGHKPSRRERQIIKRIQQQLLGGDTNAWEMFVEIVEHGTRIGAAAELAVAIEHQHRPALNRD